MKTKRKPSAPSSRRSKKKGIGDALIEGLKLARRHARGEIALPGYALIEGRDVRKLRARQGLTRKAFAERYGLDPRTVEGWEQERFGVDRSVRVLLSVIAHEPEAVVRSLRKGAPGGR
jgi:putative transcriptional regulator